MLLGLAQLRKRYFREPDSQVTIKSQVTNSSEASVMLESDDLFRGVEKGGGVESTIALAIIKLL